MFVATLGNIPRFFWRFLLRSSSSSSPVPSPEPMLASPKKDPRQIRQRQISNLKLKKKNKYFEWIVSNSYEPDTFDSPKF